MSIISQPWCLVRRGKKRIRVGHIVSNPLFQIGGGRTVKIRLGRMTPYNFTPFSNSTCEVETTDILFRWSDQPDLAQVRQQIEAARQLDNIPGIAVS